MSLETFFVRPGSSKKKKLDCKREAKANAMKANASQNVKLKTEDNAEYGTDLADIEESSEQQGKHIVDCVTANIEMMLDSKLANIIKKVGEVSEKFDSLIQRLGTVKQQISDLEDASAVTAPWVKALEVQLQKVTDRPESFENPSQRQNVRIVGLKEGTEGNHQWPF